MTYLVTCGRALSSEIWNVEFSEGETVPRAPEPP